MNALSGEAHMSLHCVGGSFRHDARSLIGPGAVESVRRYHFDKAFLGTSGITADGAFSSQNVMEGDVKRAVIAQARRTVILADRSKYGQAAFSIFARAEDVHVVIMEASRVATELASALPCEIITVKTK